MPCVTVRELDIAPLQELDVSEFVLSNELVSMALAMVAENPEVRLVAAAPHSLTCRHACALARKVAHACMVCGVRGLQPCHHTDLAQPQSSRCGRALQVNEILSELFTPDGNELYVHPATRYLRCLSSWAACSMQSGAPCCTAGRIMPQHAALALGAGCAGPRMPIGGSPLRVLLEV